MITISVFELAIIVICFSYFTYVVGVIHSFMVNRLDNEEKDRQLDAHRKMIVKLTTMIEGISKTMETIDYEEEEKADDEKA